LDVVPPELAERLLTSGTSLDQQSVCERHPNHGEFLQNPPPPNPNFLAPLSQLSPLQHVWGFNRSADMKLLNKEQPLLN